MLDFTDGVTWFVTGLGTTLLFVALIVAFAYVARKGDLR